MASTADSELGGEASGFTDDTAEKIDWLFEQVRKEDGIWPSSDTYLRQLVSATGDESDRVLCSENEEPFKGLSPHTFLRRTSKALANFQIVRNRGKELEDPFHANQYLELTSPTEAAGAIRISIAGHNFKPLDNLDDESIYTAAQTRSSKVNRFLSNRMKRVYLERRLEDRRLRYATLFSSHPKLVEKLTSKQ